MIRRAKLNDIEFIKKYDSHIKDNELIKVIRLKRVYIIEKQNEKIGFLRFGLFWDNTPFLNMLYILKAYRLKGYGKKLLLFWENEMIKENYSYVLASTVEEEDAKFFYEKNGYKRIGEFIIDNEPLEIIIMKDLNI